MRQIDLSQGERDSARWVRATCSGDGKVISLPARRDPLDFPRPLGADPYRPAPAFTIKPGVWVAIVSASIVGYSIGILVCKTMIAAAQGMGWTP